MNVIPTRPGKPLTERLEPLLPRIKEAAPAIEASRRIPAELMEDIVATGLIRGMVPVERGGGGDGLIEWLQAIRLIARADMAVGWVSGLLACHSVGVTYFDEKAQNEVWAGGPDVMVGSSGAPVGKVEPVDGGVLLSGRYPFSSGCDFCSWTMVGFLLKEDDTRQGGFYQCLVPRADYRIDDDWYTSGLKGTGSKSLIFERVFIPEYRWFGPGLEAGPRNSGLYIDPMYESPFLVMYNAPFGAIVLGGAEGALDAAKAALKSRTSSALSAQRTNSYVPRQIGLAQGALQIRGVAALTEKSWNTLRDSFQPGRHLSMAEINWWRGDDAFAARQARAGVDHLINEAGGSAQYANRPLQRFWRDIHTACEHPWLEYIGTSEMLGRSMLELADTKAVVI